MIRRAGCVATILLLASVSFAAATTGTSGIAIDYGPLKSAVTDLAGGFFQLGLVIGGGMFGIRYATRLAQRSFMEITPYEKRTEFLDAWWRGEVSDKDYDKTVRQWDLQNRIAGHRYKVTEAQLEHHRRFGDFGKGKKVSHQAYNRRLNAASVSTGGRVAMPSGGSRRPRRRRSRGRRP